MVAAAKTKTGTGMHPCTGLDGKFHGKKLSLNRDRRVASGAGVALGETAIEQDRVYFETTFEYFPKSGQSKNNVSGNDNGEEAEGPVQVDAKNNNIDVSLSESAPGSENTVKLFSLGVAVKSSIRAQRQLREGQSANTPDDHKDRWLWSWGPELYLSKKSKGKHVLGCAFDQSTGSGNIRIFMDGQFVAGPLPRGLRGIRGTCFPAIEILPESSTHTVRAMTNFAVNEENFLFPPPEDFSGLVPARGVL